MVRLAPLRFRDHAPQPVLDGARRVGVVHKSDPVGDAEDVRIDRNRRLVEGDRDDHVRRLAPDAAQRRQLFVRARHLAAKVVYERARRRCERLGFLVRIRDRANERKNLLGRRLGHCHRVWVGREEVGRHHIHASVGALRRENHRDEELEFGAVLQFGFGGGNRLAEAVERAAGAFGTGHGAVWERRGKREDTEPGDGCRVSSGMLARLIFVLFLLTTAAAAQPAPQLSPEAEVSLLTMLPGDEVYSLFGHTAYRITDPSLGLDRTYNYGTFDFDQPFFIARFARGLLDYQLSVSPFRETLAQYRYLERPIIEQRLALSQDVKQRLFELLETNYRPENRAYRYDFFFDNCSTRPRDILETALGERLHYGAYAEPSSPRTFRDLLQPYLEAHPLTDLGIDLGLGAPTDRTATPREAMFLPLELMYAYDAATLDGQALVASKDTLFWVEGAGMPAEAFDWPTLVAWLLLALGIGLTVADWQKSAWRDRVCRFDIALFGVVGLAGLIIAWLWLGTEHSVTGPNWNLLWAWPTHLVAAFLIARRNPSPVLRVYWIATALAALASAFGVFLWPIWPQAFHAAVLPLALLLALRAAIRARATTPSPPISQ